MTSKNTRLRRRREARRRRGKTAASPAAGASGAGDVKQEQDGGLSRVHDAAIRAESMKTGADEGGETGLGGHKVVKISMIIAVIALMTALIIPGFF